ncbi:App1 family protein [Maribacter sp. 2307ULW6-5]|uniref:App1 family protein n=1 Tax=Maribacter sp. 2307ULW6-5 TaxID=3386275 RepID=UPI0039BC5FF5
MEIKISLYRGYANTAQIVVSGHIFKDKAPSDFPLNAKKLKFALNMIKLFRVKTLAHAEVSLRFRNQTFTTRSMKDGFFQFIIPYTVSIEPGWHSYQIRAQYHKVVQRAQGEFIKPYPGEFGFISDIDDTFLVSHSDTFFKKIYLLLTRNINKRKVFGDVVTHYQFLSTMGKKSATQTNAFFYVSSSEWNLYPFITHFTHKHGLPKAVLKLKDIKRGLADFLFTGGGSHDHKFHKIKHLLEFYPELRFVLLGDDSQKDPDIYLKICQMFPENVLAVYIRQTTSNKKTKVQAKLNKLSDLGLATCYFRDSASALSHTKDLMPEEVPSITGPETAGEEKHA